MKTLGDLRKDLMELLISNDPDVPVLLVSHNGYSSASQFHIETYYPPNITKTAFLVLDFGRKYPYQSDVSLKVFFDMFEGFKDDTIVVFGDNKSDNVNMDYEFRKGTMSVPTETLGKYTEVPCFFLYSSKLFNTTASSLELTCQT